MGALTLAATLLAAPGAWAAGAPIQESGSFWTSVEVWFQSFVSGWFGLDAGNTGPEVTYDGAGEEESSGWPKGPDKVGPGDASTTDEGGEPDPNGG